MGPAAHPVAGLLRFGVFEVDLRAGELRKHGLKIHLQQQPFQALEMLLHRPREVVTREEFRSAFWPDQTYVDFDHGLNKAINKLREALGDSAESPRFIETVARRGYRFIADVQRVGTAEIEFSAAPQRGVPKNSIENTIGDSSRAAEVEVRPSLWWKLVVSSLILALIASAGVLSYRRIRKADIALAHPIRSLAVLPLENLSGSPSEDFFADGMTDELITDLAQIEALRVISRTSVMSYKSVRKPLPQIAQELNVDAIVEGTVLHSGERVRITAQLIEAATDKHLWAASYEGEIRDALALQNQVARSIAQEIRINVTPHEQAALVATKTVDPAAYEDYLKGRYFWNKRTRDGLIRAKDYFDQAIAQDPNYAQAYSGLADTYALLGDWQYGVISAKEALPKAEAAATKALQLDDTLGEAHISLAFCLDGYDWNAASAGREFQKGIALNPGYATAHHWYAWHLALVQRNQEAIDEMRKAESLDPLSLIINADLAELLLIAHFPDESIQQSRKTIEMDPNFAFAHNQLGQAYLQKKMLNEAVAELQQAVHLSGGSPTCVANLARARTASGRTDEAVRLLNGLKKPESAGYRNEAEIAMVYAALGDRDQAIDWLERGYAQRFNPGVLLRPGFDPLRSDARFQNMLRRIASPAAVSSDRTAPDEAADRSSQ